MKPSKRTIVAAVAITTLAFVAIPAVTMRSNCGGNSAALSDVANVATLAISYAVDASDGKFSFATASADQLRSFAHISHDHWIPDAHFLVLRDCARAMASEIIVVCDKPYRNVPQWCLGLLSPTHAAAYADGHVALISADQYDSLDKTRFVRLDDLAAGKMVAPN